MKPLTASTPLCATVDPELWFPSDTDIVGITEAKTLSGQCRSKEACLEQALSPAGRIVEGIAGGLTKGERQELIRSRGLGLAQRYSVGRLPAKSKRHAATTV